MCDGPERPPRERGLFLVEIEDVDTGEIIDTPGKRGKMIITALRPIAKPCMRFDSKDVIRWADYSCDCGRTFRIMRRLAWLAGLTILRR